MPKNHHKKSMKKRAEKQKARGTTSPSMSPVKFDGPVECVKELTVRAEMDSNNNTIARNVVITGKENVIPLEGLNKYVPPNVSAHRDPNNNSMTNVEISPCKRDSLYSGSVSSMESINISETEPQKLQTPTENTEIGESFLKSPNKKNNASYDSAICMGGSVSEMAEESIFGECCEVKRERGEVSDDSAFNGIYSPVSDHQVGEDSDNVFDVVGEVEMKVGHSDEGSCASEPEVDFDNMTLNTEWTMYFSSKSNKNQIHWQDGRQTYPNIKTIVDFWRTLNHAPLPTEIHVKNRENLCFFRGGILPDWEAPKNQAGGMWRVEFAYNTKGETVAEKERIWEARNAMYMNTMWIELLMALIGEQFTDLDKINGCIFSRRQHEDRIQLWTGDLTGTGGEEIKRRMATELKKFLNVDGTIQYKTHAELQDETKNQYGKKGTYSRSQSYAGKPGRK